MAFNESELSAVLRELRRPYQGEDGRDKQWDNNRKVVSRRAIPWTPNGLKIGDASNFTFRDGLPGWTINRIKQRLGANEPVVKVNPRGEAGPEAIRRAEKIEDWLRGAVEEMDPRGYHDGRVRGFIAADGVGCYELELVPNFVPPANRIEGSKDYDALVDAARRDYGLPVCMSSPDPRSLYWPAEQEQPSIVAKVMDRPFIDVKNAWQGVTLGVKAENKFLIFGKKYSVSADFILQGEQAPQSDLEYGKMVRIVRIADADWIYDCLYPQVVDRGDNFSDDQGHTAQLVMVAKYPNLFGRPPYYFASGRTTGDPDPAHRYAGLAKEIVDMAPLVNQWRSTGMLRGILDAIKPDHYRPARPIGENDKPVNANDILTNPGLVIAEGQFLEIPTRQMPDFANFDGILTAQYNSFDLGIRGGLQSGAIGASTPAWTLLQLNEDQISLLQEALDGMANAKKELLLDTARVVTMRNDGPVYVRTSSRSKKRPEVGRVDTQTGITPDDLRMPFSLTCTIDALTLSMRAANTEYWRQLRLDGRLSDETYDEMIGIEDPVAEAARRDREAILKPMRENARVVAWEMAKANLTAVYGPVAALALGTGPGAPQQAAAGETEMGSGPDMPGQGMSEQQPELVGRQNGAAPF